MMPTSTKVRPMSTTMASMLAASVFRRKATGD
jgi:hypothetical protein